MTTDRLRVLAVINALGEGGTERSLAELVEPLEQRGVDLTLATLRTRGNEGVEPWLRSEGRDVRRIEPAGRHLPGFRRLVRDLEPDVVHSMLFDANLTARLGGVGRSVPLLTSLVNTTYTPEWIAASNVPRAKIRLVQAVDVVSGRLFGDHFHAVSEAVKKAAVAHLHLPPSRITVVPRGRVDPRLGLPDDARATVRTELGIPADATVVVNVGRHEVGKDQRTLLQAIGPILAQRTDTWLVVAGRSGVETETLAAAVAAMGPLADRVLFLGHRADVASVLAASDLFVLSSRYEGMPGAVIEAMGVGLPVVASDIGPVREVVDPGHTALLAAPGDAPSFTRCLARLLDDPAERQALAAGGRDRFERSFEIGRSADAMASLYRRLARDPHGTEDSDPPRVLNLLNSDHRRGAEATGVALGAALSARGHDVRTVALIRSHDPNRFDVEALTRSSRWVEAVPSLWRAARDADVIVGHGGSTLLAGAFVGGLARTPFVYRVIGDPVYWTSTRLRRARVAAALRRAARVVTYFDRAADMIATRYDLEPARVRVIPKGIDARPFAPASEAEQAVARTTLGVDDPTRRVVAYVGALSPEKNVEQIIEAAAAVAHATVVLAGEGPQRPKLEHQARRLGVPARFLGPVADPLPVYRAADVVALTSRTEGIPTVALEAGLMARPLVATDVGGTSQVIIDGETGYLVEVGDVPATSSALTRAIDDKVRLGDAARRRCLDHFELDAVADDWAALLHDVADERARRR